MAKIREGRAHESNADLDLPQYIERVSRNVYGPYGRLMAPVALAPIVELFERAERGERVWALASTPPQFGKTAIELYASTRRLLRQPEHSIVFASYGQTFSRDRSVDARQIAQVAGVSLGSDAVDHWRTTKFGGFKATSVDGTLTGDPSVRLIIVDDPFKGRAEAESQVFRDKVFDWMTGTVISRAHQSTSIIVTHTRWHIDDLIGRLDKQTKPDGSRAWEYVNIPAVNAAGQHLWPELHPPAFMEQKRRSVGEYDWWSMYMGSPRPRGGAVFQDCYFYESLPTRYRVSVGIDLAYTAKTHADYSVAVVLAECDGLYYVLDVVRLQVQAPVFAQSLKLIAAKYTGAPMTAYVYGPEKGNVDWLRKQGLRVWAKSMTGDKLVRAQPVAAKWNDGKVMVPRTRGAIDPTLPEPQRSQPPEWLDAFVGELTNFTGLNDPNDDQVDGLAPAYDRIAPRVSSGSRSGGTGGAPPPNFDDRQMGF